MCHATRALAKQIPTWSCDDLAAIQAKNEATGGPLDRCAKLVRKTMYLAATCREFDDFMMFTMAVGNGWRTEQEIAFFCQEAQRFLCL